MKTIWNRFAFMCALFTVYSWLTDIRGAEAAWAFGSFLFGAFLYTVGAFLVSHFSKKPPELSIPRPSDVEFDAAAAWRSINLPIANGDHPDGLWAFTDLKSAGWVIEKIGHERSGSVTLKFTKS